MTEQLTLMQVHAHPDDEASKGAGVTARYTAEGARTILVTCTGGEAGEILNPAADNPETRANLHAVRMSELQESVRILGYDKLHLLGYRDSGMPDSDDNKNPDSFAQADFDEAVGKLIDIIRTERPQVIVTYGEDHSGYPHPDHIRTHEISLAAFERTCHEPRGPKKLYYTGWSKRRIQIVHDKLVELGKESPFAEWLEEWKDNDHHFTTRIDVAAWIPTRSKALLAHATQVAPDSFWFAVPDEMLTDIYPWEEYIRARSLVDVVADENGVETDLFSGLR